VAVEGPAHRVLEEPDGGQVPLRRQVVHGAIVNVMAAAPRKGCTRRPLVYLTMSYRTDQGRREAQVRGCVSG
jgi:hypothetical protein